MTFSIFLPERVSRHEPDPPVLYYLSGLTCSDENARTKAHFAQEAGKLGLAVVFPDTSPRGVDIPGQDDSYDFGSAAGFYVNATVNNEKKLTIFWISHKITNKCAPFNSVKTRFESIKSS